MAETQSIARNGIVAHDHKKMSRHQQFNAAVNVIKSLPKDGRILFILGFDSFLKNKLNANHFLAETDCKLFLSLFLSPRIFSIKLTSIHFNDFTNFCFSKIMIIIKFWKLIFYYFLHLFFCVKKIIKIILKENFEHLIDSFIIE